MRKMVCKAKILIVVKKEERIYEDVYDVYIQDLSRLLEVKNVRTVQSLTTNLTVVVSSHKVSLAIQEEKQTRNLRIFLTLTTIIKP